MKVVLEVNKVKIVTPKFPSGPFLDAMAQAYIAIIKERTRDGIDIHGKAFVPYPEGYRQMRISKGKNPDSDYLHFTGQMLGSLQVVLQEPKRVLIGFSGSRTTKTGKKITNARIAWENNTGYEKRKRIFFGVVKNLVTRALKEALESVGWSGK
jgi:hypothetical protein